MSNTHRLQQIHDSLTQQLHPTFLEVSDDSEQHRGHAGAKTGKGHFTVEIAASEFQDKPLLHCHRLIYQALGSLMETDIHALSIRIRRVAASE
jgi:BolA protein